MAEANLGNQLRFTEDKDAALDWLIRYNREMRRLSHPRIR
jgi:hypothetical protein